MSLPKLPELPPLEEEQKKRTTPTKRSGGLPSLPSLEDVFAREEYTEEGAVSDSGPLYDEEEYSEDTSEDFAKVETDEEGIDFEENQDFDSNFDEDFADIESAEEITSPQSDSTINNEQAQEDEEYYEKFEKEQLEGEDISGEGYSFLPIVNEDALDKSEIENLLPDFTAKKPEAKDEKKGFRELDDEAIKSFFVNLKNKLFKKGSKPNKTNPQQEKTPSRKGFNKSSLKYAAIILVLFVIGALGLARYESTYSPLSEAVQIVEQGDTNLEISNYTYKGDTVELTIANKGDISANFIMDVTFKAKTKIPLIGSKFSCQSDIIAIETDGQVQEILNCNNLNKEGFNEDLEYRITIKINEVP